MKSSEIRKKFFASEKQVWLIELDSSELQGNLIRERNPGGTNKYYHLYDGYLPLSAVTQATLIE